MRVDTSCTAIFSRNTSVSSTGLIRPAPISRPRSAAVMLDHVFDIAGSCLAQASGKAAHGQSCAVGHIGGMERDADILIVGGGLNGPALGLALAQGGLRVTVIDARPAPSRAEAGFDGRAYALAIASKRLLSVIGVWARLADKVQPILKIKASDGLAGQGPAPFFLTFYHAELEEGPMGFMAEDRFLYAAFLDAMQDCAGLTLLSGESVVDQSVTGAGVAVTLASGRVLKASVLVGCDGRGSGTAAGAMASPRLSPRSGTSMTTKASRISSSCPQVRWRSCRCRAGITPPSCGARPTPPRRRSKRCRMTNICRRCGPALAIFWARSRLRGIGSPIRCR